MNVTRSAERVVSPAVLGITAGAVLAIVVWPKIGRPIANALAGSLPANVNGAVTNGIGAVGMQLAKGFLPGPWKVTADAFSGVLVYDAVQPFVGSALPALPVGG